MKFLFSGVGISAASGSLGGSTFSHNANGPYVRLKGNPVNPSSPLQQQVRNQFTAAATSWATLTDVQRASWVAFANAIVFKDPLGQDYKLNTYQHYVRSYLAMIDAGLTPVQTGPSVLTLPEADPSFSVVASEGTQLLSVTFDNTLAWANEDGGGMRIGHSLPVGGSRNFMSQHYRNTGTVAGSGTTPPTSPDTQAAQFTLAQTQKTAVSGLILRADGRVSEPFWDTVTVAS